MPCRELAPGGRTSHACGDSTFVVSAEALPCPACLLAPGPTRGARLLAAGGASVLLPGWATSAEGRAGAHGGSAPGPALSEACGSGWAGARGRPQEALGPAPSESPGALLRSLLQGAAGRSSGPSPVRCSWRESSAHWPGRSRSRCGRPSPGLFTGLPSDPHTGNPIPPEEPHIKARLAFDVQGPGGHRGRQAFPGHCPAPVGL